MNHLTQQTTDDDFASSPIQQTCKTDTLYITCILRNFLGVITSRDLGFKFSDISFMAALRGSCSNNVGRGTNLFDSLVHETFLVLEWMRQNGKDGVTACGMQRCKITSLRRTCMHLYERCKGFGRRWFAGHDELSNYC